jgi:virulence-associated protein VapD
LSNTLCRKNRKTWLVIICSKYFVVVSICQKINCEIKCYEGYVSNTFHRISVFIKCWNNLYHHILSGRRKSLQVYAALRKSGLISNGCSGREIYLVYAIINNYANIILWLILGKRINWFKGSVKDSSLHGSVSIRTGLHKHLLNLISVN